MTSRSARQSPARTSVLLASVAFAAMAGCGSAAEVVGGTGASFLTDFDDPNVGGGLQLLRDGADPWYAVLAARVDGLDPGDPAAPDGEAGNPLTTWTVRDGGTVLGTLEVQRGYLLREDGTAELLGVRVDLDGLDGETAESLEGRMLSVEVEVTDAEGIRARDNDDVEALPVRVRVGTGESFDWEDFDDNGNELIVHMGPQGGFHVFVSVRSRNMDPGDPKTPKGDAFNPVVEWELLLDGVPMGSRTLQVGLLEGPDGWYERVAVAIILDNDVVISPSEVDGKSITIRMTVTDVHGASATVERTVTAVGVVG